VERALPIPSKSDSPKSKDSRTPRLRFKLVRKNDASFQPLTTNKKALEKSLKEAQASAKEAYEKGHEEGYSKGIEKGTELGKSSAPASYDSILSYSYLWSTKLVI